MKECVDGAGRLDMMLQEPPEKNIFADPDDPDEVVPDAFNQKVRIHPRLIVAVVENVLNFDNDETGEPVKKGDMWYTGSDINGFVLARDEECANEEQEEMVSLYASSSMWEESFTPQEGSGKHVWDMKAVETGCVEEFYMGDDGFATFDNAEEAKRDRTWNRERRLSKNDTVLRKGSIVSLIEDDEDFFFRGDDEREDEEETPDVDDTKMLENKNRRKKKQAGITVRGGRRDSCSSNSGVSRPGSSGGSSHGPRRDSFLTEDGEVFGASALINMMNEVKAETFAQIAAFEASHF